MQNALVIHVGTAWTFRFFDGIFILVLDRPIEGTGEEAWEWVNLMMDVREFLGRPFPLLTIVSEKVRFTLEGRRVMRMYSEEEHFVAHAMWTPSTALKAMVKFLMVLVPNNLFEKDVFSDKEKAFNWLKAQISKSPYAMVTEAEARSLDLKIDRAARSSS